MQRVVLFFYYIVNGYASTNDSVPGNRSGQRVGNGTANMGKDRLATLYALGAVACWSTVAAAFKIALRHQSPAALLFHACAVSCLTLFLLVLIRGDIRMLSLRTAGIPGSAALCLLNPMVYYSLLFRAYDMLPAQEAQPLNYTWGIVLSLLSAAVLRQKLRPLQLMCIALSLLGVLVIATRGHVLSFSFSNAPGAALALMSAFVWAGFWILIVRDPRDDTVKLFWNFAFGTLYSGIILLAGGGYAWPGAIGAAAAVWVGVFEMGLTFFLWQKALRLATSAARVANYIYLSPFVSLIWIHVLLGEHIRAASVAGLALIVTGLILQEKTAEKNKPAATD